MRTHTKSRLVVLVAALTLSLVASLVPAAAQDGDTAAQQIPPSAMQVGENVVLGHDDPRATYARDGVGVAVNPADPDHIVMTNNDLYDFRCEYHTSRDGGATWNSGILVAPAGFGSPSGGPESPCSSIGHGTSSMQGHNAVAFGSGGNVYVAFSSARFGSGTEEWGLSTLVARSTDGGDTFETAVEALPSDPADLTNNALPGLAVHPGSGGNNDRVVVQAEDGSGADDSPTPRSLVAAVSTDSGQTFSPRVAVNEGMAVRETSIAVSPDGTFHATWRTRDNPGSIYAARSTDGLAWEQTEAVSDVWGYRVNNPDDPADPEVNFSSSNYPRNAAGPDGTAYITWIEGEPDPDVAPSGDVEGQDHFIHPEAGVYVAASTDDGVTYGDPVRVNDVITANDGNIWNQTRHPSASVAPDGTLHIVWQDRRHWYRGCQHTHAYCNEGRLGDTYIANSTDDGASFSEDVRVSDRTQNNEIGSDYRQGVYWTYAPVAAPLGNDEVFVAWMDSRRGDFTDDKLDIYYAKVDLTGGGEPTPRRHIPASDVANLSVALARQSHPGGSEATLISTFATEPWSRLVVVNGGGPALAAAGGVLARAYLAPVLATPAGGLTARLEEEVGRLDPHRAFVLGDASAVSNQVVTDLEGSSDLGAADITRFDGSPAEIAAAMAHEMDFRREEIRDQYEWRGEDDPAFTSVVIANPESDEVATAAALASNRRLPILFVEENSVPAATAAALTDLNIDDVLVVGGPSAVSDTVLGDLPNATRMGGADVAATSQAVTQVALARGLPSNVVYVSDSDDPMGSALAGSAVGRISGLHLATPGADVDAAAAALGNEAGNVDRYVVIGGVETRQLLSWACPAGAVPGAGFTDIDGNTHETAIDCAAWYAITLGLGEGLYGPSQTVRRDQMASFIARLIDHAKPGLLPAASGANPFPGDVTEDNTHFDAIRRLAAAEIVLGLGGDEYGPSQSVRRDQMASFIHRAIAFVDTSGEIQNEEDFFGDVGPTHEENVNALASQGIVLGVGGDEYAASNAVRRDQMASFVLRGLDFLVQGTQAQLPVLTTR
ncbi:MAG: S-layer homology domain-containing protein [Egibacteraceae bacterium]